MADAHIGNSGRRSAGSPSRESRRLSAQTKALGARVGRWAAVVLLAYTAVFAVVAAAADRFVMPALGNEVADVVAPWQYRSADEAEYDRSRYSLKVTKVKKDVARVYLYRLAAGVMTDGAALTELGASIPPAAGTATAADADSADAAGAAADASDTDAAAGAAGDISYGLASSRMGLDPEEWPESSAIDFAGYPWLSDDTEDLVRQVVDVARERAADLGSGAVYDAVWSVVMDGDITDYALNMLCEEARLALGLDFSEVLLFTETARNGEIVVAVYGDGHAMVRDYTTYNQIKALKVPVAVVLYLAGCLVVMALAVRRALRYFDMLSESVVSVLSDRESTVELPAELEFAQNAINAVKLENAVNERAAKAAEQRKNELVAYLAHDIKTPLTSIMGYLSLLTESPDMPLEQRARYAGIAAQKAERLEGLIDEFFEISRYNLQQISVERSRVDVALFCSQVAEEFYPAAESRGIGIAVEAPIGGEQAFIDARKLARACGNVLKNAVAYADPETEIRFAASIVSAEEDVNAGHRLQGAGEGAGDRTLRISIENQGSEISPEHLQRIFERFYREDSARATNSGGAGLGLAIAREIVQAHGGTIEATSENGVTRFEIVIPSV